jgi:hypothetical protein
MRPASKAEGKTGGVDPLLLQEKAHSLGQSPLSMGYRPFKASIFEARFGSRAVGRRVREQALLNDGLVRTCARRPARPLSVQNSTCSDSVSASSTSIPR